MNKRLIVGLIFTCFLPLLYSANVNAAGVNGDASINGYYDSSPIVLRTSNRLAGAVESITWKGFEFVSGNDHGRSIQYAWFNNNDGCDNPTEAGSNTDSTEPTSSSLLKEIQFSGNSLTTKSQPAFWVAPGTVDADSCPEGVTYTSTLSDEELTKTITIGTTLNGQSFPNIIEFLSEIKLTGQTDKTLIFPPIIYTPGDKFTSFWSYSPKENQLLNIASKLSPIPPNYIGKHLYSDMPTILSTANNSYAVGIYSPDMAGENEGDRIYYLTSWPAPQYIEPVNTNAATYLRNLTTPGSYRYRSYLIIGSLNQVVDTLSKLFTIQPSDIFPVVGSLDSANCNYISGWSGDKDKPDESIDIHIYADGRFGSGGKLIGYVSANSIRENAVCNSLGSLQSSCTHGFFLTTPNLLKDNQSHAIFAYGINLPGTLGQNRLLSGSPKTITCPAPSPTSPATTSAMVNPTPIPFSSFLSLFKTYYNQPNPPSSVDLNNDGNADIFDYNLFVSKLRI